MIITHKIGMCIRPLKDNMRAYGLTAALFEPVHNYVKIARADFGGIFQARRDGNQQEEIL